MMSKLNWFTIVFGGVVAAVYLILAAQELIGGIVGAALMGISAGLFLHSLIEWTRATWYVDTRDDCNSIETYLNQK